jgi:hypothetical protein
VMRCRELTMSRCWQGKKEAEIHAFSGRILD